MSSPQHPAGAYAEFVDTEAARRAVRELEKHGVPRSRILVDEHAPDQSSSPIDTEERDKRTIRSLWRLGSRGAVLGLVVGAILGAAIGALMWTPMSPAWFLLAVGFAVFGIGLGILWSFMFGKGEAEHRGTVYDDPGADQPTRITVPATRDEIEPLLQMLGAAGGRNVHEVPQNGDEPRR